MRAAIFHEPRSVTAGIRPDPGIVEPTDAVVQVVLACVCGSDLWYYRGDSPFAPGPIGHDFIGVIEDAGPDVPHRRRGRSGDQPICVQRRHLPALSPRDHHRLAPTAGSSR